jgi:hypothetical protein
MDVDFIIVCLLGLIALLAIGAWFLDQWLMKPDDDDDWEPYR